MSTATELEDAYSHCEAITRGQAANFFYGIRLLPRERRRAMCAVYAFARRVDDIGDGTLAQAQKLQLLDDQARALQAIAVLDAEGGGAAVDTLGEDRVMVALADTQRRFPLPDDALAELIEGVRMDVTGVSYESFEDLVPYCRHVAGAIGRVCLAIFGLREDGGATHGALAERGRAEALADDLGVALQLTNILRDVREDAENGRVYLPAEDLLRFGVIADGERSEHEQTVASAAALLDALAHASAAAPDGPSDGAEQLERLTALVRFEAARAGEWFERGLALTALLDRRSAACVLAMAGIYRRLLERIEAHPEEALRRRMSLPVHEKAWVAARGMLGAGA
jgi:phytoene synthase